MDSIHKLLQFILYTAPYLYLHPEKNMFYWFLLHYLYIIKQTKKAKPVFHGDETLRTFENTREM